MRIRLRFESALILLSFQKQETDACLEYKPLSSIEAYCMEFLFVRFASRTRLLWCFWACFCEKNRSVLRCRKAFSVQLLRLYCSVIIIYMTDCQSLYSIVQCCKFAAVNPLPHRNTVFHGLQLSVNLLVGISIRYCGRCFHILWPRLCNCVSDSELICKAFAEKAWNICAHAE